MRVLEDFILIVVLNVLWLEIERQVCLLMIRDCADVELVLPWAIEPSHCNSVGQLGGLAAIHAHHVVVAVLGRGELDVVIVGLHHL